ncbi:MAG: M14 family metallopeptidase [Planctomycetes bacterium]|nr:M14 family metallopeptidase [Planctomycetota bacterium]
MPRFLIASLFAVSLFAQQAPAPQTRPEASNFTETSRLADVQRFVDEVVKLPHGDRLSVSVAGKTHEGRPLLLVKVALPEAPKTPRLRALVIGNIHAGEVEGKEALQELLREFAEGQHEELLAAFELWLLPIYNVDGNEAVGAKNRPGQNGPTIVGQRPNGQGFDLNRDFVKAEAPETRALLDLFRTVDPHLFMDLHTTDGSYHGYHLTYAPCLSPNMDGALTKLSRTLLDDVTARMQKEHSFAVFDYGNFETRDWDGGGAPESTPGTRGWYTYDHRARYGVNYFGLRNRIAVLSEAYSYCDFATRIAATRAFVLTTLQSLAARKDEVAKACADADARLVTPQTPAWFGSETSFAPPEMLDILVGEVVPHEPEGEGTRRYERKGDGTPERMPVFRAFLAKKQRQLPAGWAVLEPSPEVVAQLQRHGIVFTAVRSGQQADAQRFVVTKKRKPKRPFQGHQELVLEGEWQPSATMTLPTGALLVSARQPLARLAAQLLEAESEDSLSSWNFFEATTTDSYPVLRLTTLPK